MPNQRVVAIGGSAGAIETLVALVAGLPADLPVPVLVTVHIGERARSRLPAILARAGRLPAEHAVDGAPLRPGTISVAPPGAHLLVVDGKVRLSAGPRVNRNRPAVDVMFASAARWAGSGAVAVVLSGLLDDGAVGSALVSRFGGRVLAQDPAEAAFDSMPRAALAAAPGARAVPTARLAGEIVAEVDAFVPQDDPQDARDRQVEQMTADQIGSMDDSGDPHFLAEGEQELTRLTCPDCGGGLAEVRLPRITYYRCHVGHQYGPQALEAAQAEDAERKLWAALAALEAHAAMARHLAAQAPVDGGADLLHVAVRAADLARTVRSRLDPFQPGIEAPPG